MKAEQEKCPFCGGSVEPHVGAHPQVGLNQCATCGRFVSGKIGMNVTPPSPSTARDQAAVREGVETAETRMDTGFQALFEGGPNSTSTAPIAEDELRAAAAEVLKRWDTPLWRQEVGTAALMNRLRAALASRPAGEMEATTAKNAAVRFDREVELPPLPKPYAWSHTMDNTEGLKGNKPHRVLMFSKRSPFGRPGIDFSESYPVTAEALFTADQIRAYGQECARAALSAKPAAIDAEEVASILEGALVEDVLPYHSKEWITRAQALLAKLKS